MAPFLSRKFSFSHGGSILETSICEGLEDGSESWQMELGVA